jgi:hypothetical protein
MSKPLQVLIVEDSEVVRVALGVKTSLNTHRGM